MEGLARDAIFDFLRSELEIAGTSISVAETTTNRETAARNVNNARKALQTVLRLTHQLDMDSGERIEFQESYAALSQRLADLQARAQEWPGS